MRVSKLFFKTFKEAPAETDVISHQLLERAGYIKKLGRGLYTYTPLMWRVLKKLIQIIREELDRAGGQEVLMPQLQPKELWDQTGRWDDFTSAHLLYTLKDREDHPFCLGPTHEEAVTSLVNNWLTSYKQLPVNLYQIANKFRDEIRPRFGLMRAKEFIMKDAYAFCQDEKMMEEQYIAMRNAYKRIFERLNLNFAIVRADGGKIGKGKSEEFQVLASIGEDTILTCEEFAYNVETAAAIPQEFAYEAEQKPLQKLATPNVTTVEELCRFTGLSPMQMVKTLIFKLTYHDREEFVAVGIRGDRDVNTVKVANYFGPIESELASDAEIKRITGVRPGFAGPITMPIKFVADLICKGMTNFLCGSNEEDVHALNVNWGRDCKEPIFTDFLLAIEGDRCPDSPSGTYKSARGIEVGHIFNLGTKYSESMKVSFQNEQGKPMPFWMGCYGIGVGRVAQACVEQRNDEKGIIWPKALAPYQMLITFANAKEEGIFKATEEIYLSLTRDGYEVLFDDRNERLGFKLKDSDLMGIPYKCIVGSKFLETKELEIEPRVGEKFTLPLSSLSSFAKEHL